METSVDADLSRHPLCPSDTPLLQEDVTPTRDGTGPAHDGTGSAHWDRNEGEDSFGFDEEDVQCTQELDPRPLAGMENGSQTTGRYGEWAPDHWQVWRMGPRPLAGMENGSQTTGRYGEWVPDHWQVWRMGPRPLVGIENGPQTAGRYGEWAPDRWQVWEDNNCWLNFTAAKISSPVTRGVPRQV